MQEVPQGDEKEKREGPIIHIFCSEEVTLTQQATITIPVTLRKESEEVYSSDEELREVRIFHAKDESSAWAELHPKDFKVENGVVTFQVSHFSM